LIDTIVKKLSQGAQSERVLVVAPTGVAAFNVSGQRLKYDFAYLVSSTTRPRSLSGRTIHSVFRLPLPQNMETAKFSALADREQDRLKMYRVLWKDVALVIIDEFSMVGNTDLFAIHLRLSEVGVTDK
jgi:hypothetical protein